MTNSAQPITTKITVSGKELETVDHFQYLATIICEEGSKTKILTNSNSNSKTEDHIWRDRNIPLGTKVKLQPTLFISIMLYACAVMDTECRHTKGDPSGRNEMPQKTPWHLIQGPCHQQ